MYYATIQQLNKTLGNLDAILGKATEHAAARNFPVDNFMNARLAPDMLPFSRQILIACDTAKFVAASLAGQDAPKFDDDEKTVADLRARIAKTTAYLATFHAADFAQVTEVTPIKVPYPAGKKMLAQAAILSRALPNFFFHVTTAYALLRAGGIPLGKTDYLGALEMFDA